ncbi:hypothetical protein [Aphanizomenon sp. CS-733/32]|uniref:hypothetical protein n=1 Tax=Aphanizomenon sp. CS-733/32 TaxID=3021715 RepID=UPI00232F8934|nr:hypothetical protein [Aphanizomenon sp. CS-733/32]
MTIYGFDLKAASTFENRYCWVSFHNPTYEELRSLYFNIICQRTVGIHETPSTTGFYS